jgi:hypothetical protein
MTPDGAPPRQGFWKRNWKWMVPVGCLSVMGCCGCGAGAIVVGVFGVMKQSDVYQQALAEVRKDPEVANALGRPIEAGWWLTGNIQTSGSSGHADIAVPVSGPKAGGTMYVRAVKQGSRWKFTRLAVEVDGRREQIDVLHGEGASEPVDEPDEELEPEEKDDEPDRGNR